MKTEEGERFKKVGEMIYVAYRASSTFKDILAISLGTASCKINVNMWLNERNVKITLHKDSCFMLAGYPPVQSMLFLSWTWKLGVIDGTSSSGQ